MNFSGPFSAQARKLTAMPFSMIVVTTSWAPVFTFRTAGIAANAMPPSIANTSTPTASNAPGRNPRCSAAQVAVTMPTRNCPSTPMLNRPALKQTATASAEKMSGVAIDSTVPKLVASRKANSRIAL